MALSVFDDKAHEPKDAELSEALGRSRGAWDDLLESVSASCDVFSTEWCFSGQKWGWSLRAKNKKRNIVYLTPCRRYFLAGFVLGEKAVKAAHENGLPASVLAAIDIAPKYPEGRGVRFEVRNKKDAAAVGRVAAIKIAN